MVFGSLETVSGFQRRTQTQTGVTGVMGVVTTGVTGVTFPSLAVDLVKQEVIFNVVRLAATIIICIGFLLMLLPEEWDEVTLRFINSLKEKKSEEHAEDLADVSVHLRSRSRVNGTVSIPLA